MPSPYIIISSLLVLISPIVYTVAILKGRAKPHRTTLLVFLIISSIATASLFTQGNRVAIYLAGVTTIQSLAMFILSIKYGMGGWAKSDIICLILALIGIVLWRITKNPVIALYFAIGADFIGLVPTLIKSYYFPKTEIWSFFAIDAFAGFFSLLAIKHWTIQEYSYPLYIMLINIITVLLIIHPHYDHKHSQ